MHSASVPSKSHGHGNLRGTRVKTFLAADIGGTKTRLALYVCDGERLVCRRVKSLPSDPDREFTDILRTFLEQHGPGEIEAACIGAPGPVVQGTVDSTNLPWEIKEDELKHCLGTDAVRLVNDLVALAAAVPLLPPENVVTLHEGAENSATDQRCAIVSPGTGLGQAYLVRRNGESILMPSEGGHVDFGPTCPQEVDLLKYLQKKLPRVSCERVLSGPGLENIYDFLRDTVYLSEPMDLTTRFEKEDRARVISESGLDGHHEITREALDIFVRILGTHAGNVALSFWANGGVYIGGGIAPKILPRLRQGPAVEAFLRKHRMSEMVARVPLKVILDDHAPLLGAAAIASRLHVDVS
jgi:glucokinase